MTCSDVVSHGPGIISSFRAGAALEVCARDDQEAYDMPSNAKKVASRHI